MEKKTFKFNVIDIMVAVLAVLLVGVVLWKVAGATAAGSADGNAVEVSGEVDIRFVAKAEKVAAEIYDNVQEHIPGQLMASGVLYDGWVVAVEKEPYLVLTADGKWVEDPRYVALLFTVEAKVPNETVLTNLLGTQEIRIGRPGYILKTECLEFRDTVILDVQWENWTPAANQ